MLNYKMLLQPKILRLLALGLALFASLFLLIQDNYSTGNMVALGLIRWDQGQGIAGLDILVSNTGSQSLRVSAPWPLRRQLSKHSEETEFLAVIGHRGETMVFERIYVLTSSQARELQGPRWETGANLQLAVGTKPELVEMVGLNRFGYRLSPPVWAKQNLPGADMVYYQQGREEAVKKILDGDTSSFAPDVYIIDDQSRVNGLREIIGGITTLPVFLRLSAFWLYLSAFILGLGSFFAYKLPSLKSAGKRIWDQVSRRTPKATS